MQTSDLYKIVGRGRYLPLDIRELELTKSIERLDPNKKRGILLIHGFTSTPAVYRELIAKLPPNYNIICPTLAGHAQSLSSFAQSTGQDWFNSAEQAYLKLAQYSDEIFVIGLSLGGLIALDLAHKHKVNKLVVLAPALELYLPFRIIYCMAKLLGKVLSAIPALGGNIKKVGSYEIAYKKLPLPAIISFLEYSKRIRQLGIPKDLPIKIFLGRFDQVVNVKKVAQIFKSHDNCKISWLESSAHVLTLDNDFQSLVLEIEEFIGD